MPFTFLSLGRWWGSDPRKKSEAEIDIVASNGENSLLFCECKWTNEAVDASILETLVERAQLLPAENRHYCLFARSGFTDRCRKLAESTGRVRLVTFDEMM
ncbi:MAG: restriction endonuclease, partial [Mailhella sp.]|nr:restriction endonuclease [Mailhella sp.]